MTVWAPSFIHRLLIKIAIFAIRQYPAFLSFTGVHPKPNNSIVNVFCLFVGVLYGSCVGGGGGGGVCVRACVRVCVRACVCVCV